MKRRIDEFRWHCGSHPCAHPEASERPRAWRYSVVNGDIAFSLIICATGGELALHRGFKVPSDEVLQGVSPMHPTGRPRRDFVPCDLLGGGNCVPVSSVSHVSMGLPSSSTVDVGLEFWRQHGVMGVREQPERFWRSLEKHARRAADDARAERYTNVPCPRCGGSGSVTLRKPAAQKRAPRGI